MAGDYLWCVTLSPKGRRIFSRLKNRTKMFRCSSPELFASICLGGGVGSVLNDVFDIENRELPKKPRRGRPRKRG